MILLVLRVGLALLFAVAGVGKLRDRDGATRALRGFGVPVRWAGPGAVALPISELVVAGLLVATPTSRGGAIAALALIGLFMIVIGRSIARGDQQDCNCFGTIHSAPVGWMTLARNLVFGGVAAAIVIAGPGRSLTAAFDGVKPWAVVVGVVVVMQLLLSWQLFRQNGRLILRVRTLEQRLGPDRPAARVQHGLDPGVPAPEFELPDLDGRPLTLDDLLARGRPAALVFSDPGCGACVELLPVVARAERDRSDLTIALITTGDVMQNRLHLEGSGLATVLLADQHQLSTAYAVKAMPAAVLIDLDGRIASPLAVGGPRVEELLLSSSSPRSAGLIDIVTEAAR